LDDLTTYYTKAAALCSKAEKCSTEIRKKLSDWGAGEEIAEKVIKKLVAEKFIDDTRYASFFVKDKFRFNKWGRIKISYMLRQKGISSETITEAMQQIDEADYRETLQKLLQGKSRNTSAKNPYDQKARLLRFAQSRGFENDMVFQVLATMDKKS